MFHLMEMCDKRVDGGGLPHLKNGQGGESRPLPSPSFYPLGYQRKERRGSTDVGYRSSKEVPGREPGGTEVPTPPHSQFYLRPVLERKGRGGSKVPG